MPLFFVEVPFTSQSANNNGEPLLVKHLAGTVQVTASAASVIASVAGDSTHFASLLHKMFLRSAWMVLLPLVHLSDTTSCCRDVTGTGICGPQPGSWAARVEVLGLAATCA
jgi:hypothetical protein